ncbi:hypothetical protein HN011_012163 [Eciton burchellii]|nr:hypothetical protein HN011_012163 [Eciton burchellii]
MWNANLAYSRMPEDDPPENPDESEDSAGSRRSVLMDFTPRESRIKKIALKIHEDSKGILEFVDLKIRRSGNTWIQGVRLSRCAGDPRNPDLFGAGVSRVAQRTNT